MLSPWQQGAGRQLCLDSIPRQRFCGENQIGLEAPEVKSYKIAAEENMDVLRSLLLNTLYSRLVSKRGLKSSGTESSVRAKDQDFSDTRDRASISARGI